MQIESAAPNLVLLHLKELPRSRELSPGIGNKTVRTFSSTLAFIEVTVYST